MAPSATYRAITCSYHTVLNCICTCDALTCSRSQTPGNASRSISLVSRWVDTLAYSCPLRYLCPHISKCPLHSHKVVRTVNALPVASLVPRKDSILVLGQHLRLTRHLRLPSLHCLQLHPLSRQCIVHDGDDLVDALEAEAVSVFAGRGEFPGRFPVRGVSVGRALGSVI